MKKTNFFKIVMTLVLAFVVTGAGAQLATVNTDFEATPTDYVTVGGTLPYYVQPDGDLSPDFDATASLTANVNTTFTWTFDGSISDGDVTADDNYVELTFGTTGNYTIEVEETFASCPGTPVTLDVEVIDEPTADIAGTDANVNYSWTLGASGNTSCVPATTGIETITITITEDAELPVDFRSYALSINERVYNVEPTDFDIADGGDIANTTWDYPISDKLKTGHTSIPGDHTWTPNGVGTATSTYVFETSTLQVENSKPTRYDYTISPASDATTGLVSAISHKSDYGTAVSEYALGTTNVSYIVLPAPTTGPIYHISNDFNY